jgi:hypothetical protein
MNKLQKASLYGSHMPILARIMDLTDGPVLELGMGIYSTPLLDLMCRETKRDLVSLDNDTEWFDSNVQWASGYHKVYFVEDWANSTMIESRHWSVALVDEKPASNRIKSIKRLAHQANFVIIHDSEPESNKFFKYSWIYNLFKYRYDYTKCRPNTTVLSNFIDLKFLERDL